jgi:hypothetical protein
MLSRSHTHTHTHTHIHTHTYTRRSSAVPARGGGGGGGSGGRCCSSAPLLHVDDVDVGVVDDGGERAVFGVAVQPCCRVAAASEVRSSAPGCPERRATVPSVEEAPAPCGRSVEGHGVLPTSLGVRRSVAGGASESDGRRPSALSEAVFGGSRERTVLYRTELHRTEL